jgi:ABC-2 type transport system ATP-binding protein
MRLSQLEGYCAPLYPTWDTALATRLRDRFALDPMQRVAQMSRGQRMKAALLCALAPRPSLLLMDEPFTGVDVATKDDLVRGLLDTATGEGCTVLVCTHDIAEIELLADWVGFLREGRIEVSAPLESLRDGYKRVELTLSAQATVPTRWPSSWLQVQQAGHRVSALMPHEDAHGAARGLPRLAAQVDVHDVTLKELYLALGTTRREVAA